MANQYNNFSVLKTDPMRNFKFLVTINHNPTGGQKGSLGRLGFVSVEGLSLTTEPIPYRQGGYNTTTHQIPGQTSFTPVTLQRGVMLGTRQSWDWMRQLFATVVGTGLFPSGGVGAKSNNFRCTVDIEVLDHPATAPITGDGSVGVTVGTQFGSSPLASGNGGFLNVPVKMAFRLYNAWITTLSYSNLNAGDNSLLVEQMTLVHEGFDVIWATDQPGSDAHTAGNFVV